MYIPPPLHPLEVRWFYLEPGKFWQPFGGHDSIILETAYLDKIGGRGVVSDEVDVMGDLYVVKMEKRILEPLYWPSEA